MKSIFCIYAFALVFYTGCKKDNYGCKSIPPPDNGGYSTGWNYQFDNNYCKAPSFNPNNSNEFAFLKRGGAGYLLCKYNMQTQVLTTLYTGNIFYKPDWGSNDWILFNVNNDIYKIKSNGDSLTRLTANGFSVGGNWVNNSNQYIYNLYAGYGNGYLIASSTGDIIDSFIVSTTDTGAWLDTSLIIVNSGQGFMVFGGRGHVPKIINCGIDISSYSLARFVSESSFIWGDYTGLHVTNIQTSQTSTIKPINCNSYLYLSPSYSFQSNKVIWNKVVETPVNSETLNVKSSIVIMNPDGSDEQEINIP